MDRVNVDVPKEALKRRARRKFPGRVGTLSERTEWGTVAKTRATARLELLHARPGAHHAPTSGREEEWGSAGLCDDKQRLCFALAFGTSATDLKGAYGSHTRATRGRM